MKKRHAILCVVSAIYATQGIAQEEPFNLGTIVLGVRLFDEPARDVPGSVVLKFPETLPPRDTLDLGDITRDVPNVIFQDSNADERLVIRGISAYPNALADPVGVIVNGVALPLGTIQAPTPIALDQATVLVGPQGAHYGRNSEAGLISLELAEPGGQDVTRLQFTAAEDQTFVGSVLLNRRFDNVGLVFAIEKESSDGEISNTVTGDASGGDRDRLTGYAGISFETDNGTTLALTHIHENEDIGKEQFRYSDGLFQTPRFQSNYSDRSSESRTTNITSLRVQHSFEWGEFISITGLTGFDRDFTLDFDTSPLTLGVTTLDLKDRAISQEFRLSSPSESSAALKWSAGVSFYQQDTDVTFDLGAFATMRQTRIEQEGAALFGFAEYAVSERLRLGAGARLDYTTSTGTQTFTSPLGASTYAADQSSTEFLPKLTAAYDLTPQTLVYGSLSRGYLAGGYNYNFANSAANFTFDPEYTTTAEVGVRFSGARTALDIAAFYSDVANKQIVEVVPGGAQRIENAASVKVYGIEATVDHQINDAWSFLGTAGLQSARAKSFQTTAFRPGGLVPVDYSGNDLPFAPNMTYALGVQYDKNDWYGNVSLNGSSGYFFDAANTLEQDALMTIDASLGWRSGNTDITLWVTNLLDEQYLNAALNTPRGTLVEDGAGRRVGFTVSTEW